MAHQYSPDGSLVAFSRVGSEVQVVNRRRTLGGGRQWRGTAPNSGSSNLTRSGLLWPGVVVDRSTSFLHPGLDEVRSIESCDLRGEQVTNIFPSKSGQKYVYTWEAMHSLCWAPDGRILFSMQETGPVNSMRAGKSLMFGRSRSILQPAGR